MSCEEKMTEISGDMESMVESTAARLSTSRKAVGSSSRTTSAFWTNAVAMAAFWNSPSLSVVLEGADADEAHQALYDIIRAAFLAGWRSAGGDPPQEQKLFELIPGGKPLKPSE